MYTIKHHAYLLIICLGLSSLLHSMKEGGGRPDESLDDIVDSISVESFEQKKNLLGSLRQPLSIKFAHPPVFNSQGDYFGNLDDPSEKISAVELEKMKQDFSCIPNVKKLLSSMRAAKSNEWIASLQIVLEGPPGTGKTTLSKILAAQAGLKYRFIHSPSLFTTYKDSASDGLHKAIQPLLTQADQPCVLIIDEFTRLTEDYNREHNQDTKTPTSLWTLLDRCQNNSSKIMFIGTTNDKSKIPEALQSRLQICVHMDTTLPNLRLSILKSMFKSSDRFIFEIENDENFIVFINRKMNKGSLRDINLLMRQVHLEATGRGEYNEPFNITKTDVESALYNLGYLRHPVVVYSEKLYNGFKILVEKSAPYVIPWVLSTATQVVLHKNSLDQQQASLDQQFLLTLLSTQMSFNQFEANAEAKKVELTADRRDNGKIYYPEAQKIIAINDQALQASKDSVELLQNLKAS